MIRGATFALALVVSATAAQADSFKCGRWVISEDLSPAEIREKCGAPDEMSSKTEDVRGPGPRGIIKVGTTTIERWTYRRGTQAPPMVVTIVDGKVQSIVRGEWRR